MIKSLSAKFRPNYCVELTVHDGDIVYVSIVNYKVGSEKPVDNSVQEVVESQTVDEASEEQSQDKEKEIE